MNKLYLYWWSLDNVDGKDNYGDILAPFLASKLSGKKIVKVSHPMDRYYRWFFNHYVTVGSIICAASKKSIVWGSGIIKENDNVRRANFKAVRGPRTRKRLLELGYQVPEIYGDPAILLPEFINNQASKKNSIGIIPHYVDYEAVKKQFEGDDSIKVIDLMTDDIIKTTLEILECENIISSSLHGVIVAHAYSIPAIWVKFSDKLSGDNVKFYDYFESVGLNYTSEFYVEPSHLNKNYLKKILAENPEILLPDPILLDLRKKQLLYSCPFKK